MASAQPGGIAQFLVAFGPFLIIIGIMYVLIIRPQQKRLREEQKMREQVKKGDKVVTTGGIIGVVAGVKDKQISLKIADNVKVDVVKSHIATVLADNDSDAN